ncbi:MAG: dTMP kinase [Eubacteriales bacterium]
MKKLDMRKNDTSGFLITFCGLDGCGKTTMMKRLIGDLEKEHDIFVTKQPTGAVRNSEIFRTYMDCPDHDAFDYRSLSLLAASDRLQHVNKVIEPEIKNGKIVLSDRYFYSCLANLRARGFEKDEWIYEIAESVIKPDIAFFFDVPVEEAVARVRRRPEERDRYIDMDLQYKLRKEYVDICYTNGGILISTMQSEDECYEIVRNAVKKVLYYFDRNSGIRVDR